MIRVTLLGFHIRKNGVYEDYNQFMVSWWGSDSYFNNGKIKVSDIEIMNAVLGSSGKFGSRDRYKCIDHKTCTGIRSNFRSKPTLTHGQVHK